MGNSHDACTLSWGRSHSRHNHIMRQPRKLRKAAPVSNEGINQTLPLSRQPGTSSSPSIQQATRRYKEVLGMSAMVKTTAALLVWLAVGALAAPVNFTLVHFNDNHARCAACQ